MPLPFTRIRGQYIAAFSLLLVSATLHLPGSAQQSAVVTPEIRSALNNITAASLRTNLSYIASDELEGRATPSPGLDKAAEYIAAQFKKAGLEPAGDDGYFQTAHWEMRETVLEGTKVALKAGGKEVVVPAAQTLYTPVSPLDGRPDLIEAAAVKVEMKGADGLEGLAGTDLAGKIVLTKRPNLPLNADRSQFAEAMRTEQKFLGALKERRAQMAVFIDARGRPLQRAGERLVDPKESPNGGEIGIPFLNVSSADAAELFETLPVGQSDAAFTARLTPSKVRPVKIRNVAGILRGSDPALKDTYVLVTAHYDHLGMRPTGEGDRIYNGANDDGSGTVSVMEIAKGLASLRHRPKRSILFMTFFGEERGLLGSRFYGRNPLVPIAKTIADMNLEQIGRTDDSEGAQVAAASMTGFDYTDVGPIFQAAGEAVGVKVTKRAPQSDLYFGRSDNQALADQGVPAHTLCVAYEYPDYHGLADHADKIDYANMEKIDRMVALGLWMIAESPAAPKWNEANTRTAGYVAAWKKLHGQ